MSALVILAAGRGSRLGAMADARPKCMTPLLGRPWLHWQLDACLQAGLNDITLVTGHAAEALPAHPAIGRRVHQPDWAHAGPVASLWAALVALPDAPLVIAYGDCLWHPQWLCWLDTARAPVALTVDLAWAALWSARFADPLADAETLRLGPRSARKCRSRALREIGARASRIEDIEAQFMGLLRFSASGTAFLRGALGAMAPAERDRLDVTALLARWLAQGVEIEAIVGDGAWLELDHASDLALYQRAMAQPGFRHDFREPPA